MTSNGTLGALQIFRSDDTYPVDPPLPELEKSGSFGDWEITAKIGQIPSAAVELVALVDRGRNVVLDYLFGGLTRHTGAPERGIEVFDAAVDAAIAEHRLAADWTDPARLYTTIMVRRPVQLPIAPDEPGPRHFWLPLTRAEGGVVNERKHEPAEAIGFAVARLLTGSIFRNIGPKYFPLPQFFVEQAGRRRTLVNRLSGSGHATVGRGTADDAIDELRGRALQTPRPLSTKARNTIGKLGRLYLDSCSEPDNFHRFMASYSGLELIANAIGGSSWARDALIEKLAATSTLSGATFRELLWPKDVLNTDPNRPVRFRFAVAAAMLGEDTANDDVQLFVRVNEARNTIHAGAAPFSDLPAIESFRLFDRYVGPAVARLADG